ncbi:leucine--tRNA ligase [Ferruginibacter lapsinanis]|uniref:leucine--tRNA ligase n=1 Tax=Ferruginibacter lapsinanis TaxID=563172 RepID=UPI001E59F47F|nr:leucine--tRNA ligase [Ferruginibacter lapsinanis]UEG50415.1 leucine--tRNA ligase [Ferruginibacter lapsinanis]
MEYKFNEIEKKWQDKWNADKVYKVNNESDKPKFYVLDMFPYPSGAGLHVGHPLGYIASDIYARYKRLKGFNVLHPMGFDSFGLPAEQYALETGQHPAETTKKNIATFKSQLDKIGFCYDWDREIQTSNPNYYKWTQKIFLELFNSYFCNTHKKARPIAELIKKYETKGCNKFTAEQWNGYSKKEQEDILMNRRLAFSKYGEVNWCEALGTVLANDEVVNGVSERGGHPVVKKKMRQWYLRITSYADRLLEGLETVDFSESMKEMQRNWIGRSEGAEMDFAIKGTDKNLRVYTTRPDTIFGVDFMVVAPEHELVNEIKSVEQATAVDEYIAYVKSRSDVDRMAEKKITGCFTGAYAINPFDGKEIPIYISEYVLAGYGTGAIMAVPCGDERDFKFAKHFNIPITNIIGDFYNGEEANPTKEATLQNSGFLNGLLMKDAISVAVSKIEEMGIGVKKVNYKMRDAGFSRQRYWGEPFPIIWQGETAVALEEKDLPLELPHVDKYGPGREGEGPLGNLEDWVNTPEGRRETSTMPGYAGSSWYFLRYMDPNNATTFCDKKASDYWNQVDVYVGGTEHAVGHLLYSRMWTKVLYDLGYISFDEPFKKLVNQGMIQGSSRFVFRVVGTNQFVSAGLKDKYETSPLHVDVNFVDGVELNTEEFKRWKNGEYTNAEFIFEDGKYICGAEVEKMSKSKYNTVNPDELCNRYGADTFRMYEMFLGPVEMSKPWDTKGIEGVHRFLRKLWRLFFDDIKGKVWTDSPATDAELKVLHKTIKKIDGDTANFSYNTAVSAFMVCVNELGELKCHKKEILEKLLIILTPYAPHIAEELWYALGNTTTILDAAYPTVEEKYLIESSKEYPVSINGKMRTTIDMALDITQEEAEKIVLANEVVQKWLEGKAPKKVIYVKNKMVNVVV